MITLNVQQFRQALWQVKKQNRVTPITMSASSAYGLGTFIDRVVFEKDPSIHYCGFRIKPNWVELTGNYRHRDKEPIAKLGFAGQAEPKDLVYLDWYTLYNWLKFAPRKVIQIAPTEKGLEFSFEDSTVRMELYHFEPKFEKVNGQWRKKQNI